VDKIGRSDSCPCGSGKTYERCCLFSSAKDGLAAGFTTARRRKRSAFSTAVWVRGHWRRPAANWTAQGSQSNEHIVKRPEIAGVIERACRRKPSAEPVRRRAAIKR